MEWLPVGRFAGWWRRRGFALFCLATDGLTLLPMPTRYDRLQKSISSIC
jgi:hypothetical protein